MFGYMMAFVAGAAVRHYWPQIAAAAKRIVGQ